MVFEHDPQEPARRSFEGQVYRDGYRDGVAEVRGHIEKMMADHYRARVCGTLLTTQVECDVAARIQGALAGLLDLVDDGMNT